MPPLVLRWLRLCFKFRFNDLSKMAYFFPEKIIHEKKKKRQDFLIPNSTRTDSLQMRRSNDRLEFRYCPIGVSL